MELLCAAVHLLASLVIRLPFFLFLSRVRSYLETPRIFPKPTPFPKNFPGGIAPQNLPHRDPIRPRPPPGASGRAGSRPAPVSAVAGRPPHSGVGHLLPLGDRPGKPHPKAVSRTDSKPLCEPPEPQSRKTGGTAPPMHHCRETGSGQGRVAGHERLGHQVKAFAPGSPQSRPAAVAGGLSSGRRGGCLPERLGPWPRPWRNSPRRFLRGEFAPPFRWGRPNP